MKARLPDPSRVLKAVSIYLAMAYDGPPPTAVRSLVEKLQLRSDDFFAAPLFAASGNVEMPRLALRLGNRAYPHMKLVLDPAPDGKSYLYKADTHDRHIQPSAGSPELPAFQQLMQQNQKLADRIESAWAEADVPTFKTYLQQDLARRQVHGKATI